MNITTVINDIKLSQGLNTIALPYNKPVEVVIKEILETSVRTFSQFKPWKKEVYELRKNLRSENEAAAIAGVYFIPSALSTTPVHYCDAEYVSSTPHNDKGEANINAFTVVSPFVGFGSYNPQDIMNAQITGAAINKYVGVTSQPPTAEWLGYNRIRLFNFPKDCAIHFIAKCDHDLNCETIEDSCRESFITLATLDVQRTLYNQIKNMNNVGSAYKEIQLKIEDWAGAQEKRDTLVREWTESFHLDEVEELVQFF